MMAMLLSIPMPALAKEKEPSKIVQENVEIKDQKNLLERAEKGISDLSSSEVKFIPKADLKNLKNGQTVPVKTLETTQLLSTSKNGNIEEKSYATTSFALVPNDQVVSTEDTSGNQSRGQWDSSYGVYAYSTVYWDIVYINGYESVTISQITGGWTIEDTTITLSDRVTKAYVVGTTFVNGYQQYSFGEDDTNIYTNTFNIWYGSYYFNPVAVSGATDPSVSLATFATLHRGGSNWSLRLDNIVYK